LIAFNESYTISIGLTQFLRLGLKKHRKTGTAEQLNIKNETRRLG